MLDFFSKLNDLYTIPHELAAIWVTAAVATNEGKKLRLAPGMQIHYNDGCVSLNATTFNKVIVTCYGTLADQFRIKVRDLETGIESMIPL